MAVSRATLRTDTWDTVYNHLQTGTYAISTSNIFSSMNSALIKSKGYPIVIIYPPNTSFMKETVTGAITNSNINILIEVYDDNSQDVKALADEVTNKLITGKSVLQAVRLMNMTIEDSDSDSWVEGQKKIHRISFNVTFRYISDG